MKKFELRLLTIYSSIVYAIYGSTIYRRTDANLQLPDPTCIVYWLRLRLTVSVHQVAAYMSEYNCPPRRNRCT